MVTLEIVLFHYRILYQR